MTFESIYRDVVSAFGVDDLPQEGIYSLDIFKALNNTYKMLRAEYIKNDRKQFFSINEDLYFTIKDLQYPYLRYSELLHEVYSSIPIQEAVLTANIYIVSSGISNTVKSYSKGDIKRKGDKVYKCIKNTSEINTYSLIFNSKDVRNYKTGNQVTYYIGDVIFDISNSSYYMVDVEFEATDDIVLADIATEVFWKEIKSAYSTPIYYELQALNSLKLIQEIEDYYGYSVKGNKVYASANTNRMSFSYIPEWTDVNDFTTDIPIPDTMVTPLTQTTIGTLANRIKQTGEQANG